MNAVNTSTNDLTTGTVWKRLFVFFLPIALGTIIQQLYNAVDGLVVGRFVGTSALAAVGGSAAQIINVLVGFFVAMTAGAAVVIGQIFGAGRRKDLKLAIGNAIAALSAIGILLMIFGIVAARIMLVALQTPMDTLDDSVLYLRIYFIGVPFIMALNMESAILRALGDSIHPFIYMIAGCLLNIVLDITFVVVFHMGVAGVAIATVIAQVLNMVLLTIKLMGTKEDYCIGLRDLKLHGVYLSHMMRLGVPAGLQSSMYSISNMIIQIAINTLGTTVVASWAMTSKLDGFYWAVTNAMGAAITSFTAQNYGAGRLDRVHECVKQGMIMHLLGTIAISAVLFISAIPLLNILTTDKDVISTTFTMMTYFVPFYFTWVPVEVLSAVLRGVGDAVKPVIIIGISVCLFRVVWIIFVFGYFHTLFILCISYLISWVLAGTWLFIYYKKGKWDRQNKVIIDK